MTLAGILRADIVAKIGILKSAAENLTQTNRANDRAIRDETDEDANRRVCPRFLEEGSKLFSRYRRRDEASMKTSAGAVERNALSAILFGWSAQQDSVTNNSVR